MLINLKWSEVVFAIGVIVRCEVVEPNYFINNPLNKFEPQIENALSDDCNISLFFLSIISGAIQISDDVDLSPQKKDFENSHTLESLTGHAKK